MTDDPPRRWPDDSDGEDFAVHQAGQVDDLALWIKRQRLEEQLRERGMPGRVVDTGTWMIDTPSWWQSVEPPLPVCALCQHGRLRRDPRRRHRLSEIYPTAAGEHDARICRSCYREQRKLGEPDPAMPAWLRLSPQDRRFAVAATFKIDPWSGRRGAQVGYLQLIDDSMQRVPLHGLYVPRGRWHVWRARGRSL